MRIRQRAKRPLKNLGIRSRKQKMMLIGQRDVIITEVVVGVPYGLTGTHMEDGFIMRVIYAKVLLKV